MENEQYRIIVDERLTIAKARINDVLVPIVNLSDEQARNIIGTYRVAIEPNFIPWMIQAYQHSKNEKARKVIGQNIYDEITQDHPKMLRDFAQSCGVSLTESHYQKASKPVLDMWDLFSKNDGLMNLSVAATLENTSLLFVPYLAEMGKKLGCKDFKYTNVHGEADIEHARDLLEGLVDSMKNYTNPWRTISTAIDRTVGFLENILKP